LQLIKLISQQEKMDASTVYRPVADSQLTVLELPFYYLGLTTVPRRFLAGTLGTGAFIFYLKPSSMFYDDGTARPWKLTASDEGATFVPWWLMSAGIGIVLATFV
jgi:hypothetical protein